MPEFEVFVPVAVDAERTIDGTEMSRVTYFVITTEAPGSDWQIPLPPVATLAGVGALGVSGVVYRALRAAGDRHGAEPDLFTRPSDISALFALEGRDPSLSIQLEDVWIPTDWLRGARDWGTDMRGGRQAERGLVYRIGLATFQATYRYTAGDYDLEALTEVEGGEDVFFS
ncbi:MAG: hypothetical protein ACREA0_16330, partial [bacterium]